MKFNSHYEVGLAYGRMIKSKAVKVSKNDCVLYSTNRYQIIRYRRLGEVTVLYAHQLALLFGMKLLGLPDKKQVSHRCGKKSCINFRHVVLESQSQNKSRDICHKNRICRGHIPQPPCVV